MITFKSLDDFISFIEIIKNETPVKIFGENIKSSNGINIDEPNGELFKLVAFTNFGICYFSKNVFFEDQKELERIKKLYNELNPIESKFYYSSLEDNSNIKFTEINK